MSKQLAVSAAFSAFAMLAFALLATPSQWGGLTSHEEVGISAEAETPTSRWQLPAFALPRPSFN